MKSRKKTQPWVFKTLYEKKQLSWIHNCIRLGDPPYPGVDSEHMAVVSLGLNVFCDVSEVAEVIAVLARAVNVADLVLADCILQGGGGGGERGREVL